METASSSSVKLKSVDEVVEEIMRIHRSLPTRPGIDEVEAAKALIINVEREDQARVEAIARQSKSPHVPEELFMILQEMQKNLVYFQSKEQKREALKLLDLENAHSLFDEFIQRASKCVVPNNKDSNTTPTSSMLSTSSAVPTTLSSSSSSSSSRPTLYYSEREPIKTSELFTRDDSYVKKTKSSFKTDGIGIGIGFRPSTTSSTPQIFDSSLKPPTISGKSVSLHFIPSFLPSFFAFNLSFLNFPSWCYC